MLTLRQDRLRPRQLVFFIVFLVVFLFILFLRLLLFLLILLLLGIFFLLISFLLFFVFVGFFFLLAFFFVLVGFFFLFVWLFLLCSVGCCCSAAMIEALLMFVWFVVAFGPILARSQRFGRFGFFLCRRGRNLWRKYFSSPILSYVGRDSNLWLLLFLLFFLFPFLFFFLLLAWSLTNFTLLRCGGF